MKLSFGIKNVVKFILALMMSGLSLYISCMIIYEKSEIDNLYDLFFALGVQLFILYFSARYAISQIIPKQFKEMRAVKKFISFSELKGLVENEIFAPLDLLPSVRNIASKSAIKEFEKGLLVSQNWIYANNVMIPKKMIVSISVRYSHHRHIFTCNLVNSSEFEFASIRLDSDDKAKHLTDYFGRCFGISDTRNITNIDEHIEKFKKDIHTKEDFLQYIY